MSRNIFLYFYLNSLICYSLALFNKFPTEIYRCNCFSNDTYLLFLEELYTPQKTFVKVIVFISWGTYFFCHDTVVIGPFEKEKEL